MHISNFRSFEDDIEIDFTENLEEGKNIFLIGGMNGSGKTSFLDAINYCLYGAKKDVILKCINEDNFYRRKYDVQLDITLFDDKNELKIERSYKIDSTKTKPRALDIEEYIKITKNDEPIEKGYAESYLQDFLQTIIPQNISQLFFFNGMKIQDIVKRNFSQTIIKESIESLLGIELLKRLRDDVQKIVHEERKKNPDITDQNIKIRELEIEEMENQQKQLEGDITDLENDIADLETEKDEKSKEFEELFGEYPGVIERKKELEILKKQKEKELREIDYQIEEFCKKDLANLLLIRHFPNVQEQIEKERNLKRTLIPAGELDNQINQLIDKLFLPKCVVCNTDHTNENRDMIFQKIKDAFKQDTDLNEKLLLDLSDKDGKYIIRTIDEMSYSKINQFKQLLGDKENLEKVKARIEREFSAIDIDESNAPFDNLKNALMKLWKAIGRRKEELSGSRDKLAKLKQDVGTKRRDLDSAYDKREKIKGKDDLIEYLRKIFSITEKYIVELRKSKIEALQDNLTDVYKKVYEKAEIIDKVTIDDNFDITISKTDGKKHDKEKLSAGEKEVLAVSFLYALSKTSNIELPIIIDTPFAVLDSVHSDNLVKNYFPTAAKQVIVLSHDREISPDGNLYFKLKECMYNEKTFYYDKNDKKTIIQDGYFVDNN